MAKICVLQLSRSSLTLQKFSHGLSILHFKCCRQSDPEGQDTLVHEICLRVGEANPSLLRIKYSAGFLDPTWIESQRTHCKQQLYPLYPCIQPLKS